jgi:hypothetical protein
MTKIVTVTAADGSSVQFVDELKASGGMKDVYFSPNRDYVVAFFRGPADAALRERLAMITGTYRERIMNQPGCSAGQPRCSSTMAGSASSRRSTRAISFSSMVRATMTRWASRAARKKGSGLPRRRTATSSSTRASWATG